jgi:uncharacterized repeat protein (TIGR02543 family)
MIEHFFHSRSGDQRIIWKASFACLLLVTIFSASCNLGAWRQDIVSFLETGSNPVQVSSISFSQDIEGTGLYAAADGSKLCSAVPTKMTIAFSNPNQVAFRCSVAFTGASFTASPPSSVDTGADSLDAVTFNFVLAPSMENLTLAYTITNGPLTGGTQIPQVSKAFSLVCDSPPEAPLGLADDVSDAVTGLKFIAFGLPSKERDQDLSKVKISWEGRVSGSVELGVSDSTLTAARLNSSNIDIISCVASSYRRYYGLSIDESNGCDFSVSFLDSGGQESAAVTVNTDVIHYTLSYDGNGADSGQAPAAATVYDYGATPTVLGNVANSPFVKANYVYRGWNSLSDGSGDSFLGGSSVSMTAGSKILYAQWVEGGGLDVTLSLGQYQNISFDPSASSVRRGKSITVGYGASLSGAVWSWYLDGTLQVGASASSFTYAPGVSGTIGEHSLGCVVVYGGVTYSGSLPVAVERGWLLSYDANGASGVTVPASQEYLGDALIVSAASLTRPGYAFKGWALSASATEPVYAVGGSYSIIPTKDTTLYALWSPSIAPVSGVSCLVKNAKVKLNWTEPTDAALTKVVISYSSGDGSAGSVTLSPGSAGSGFGKAVIAGLTNGSAYTFVITDYSSSGATASASLTLSAAAWLDDTVCSCLFDNNMGAFSLDTGNSTTTTITYTSGHLGQANTALRIPNTESFTATSPDYVITYTSDFSYSLWVSFTTLTKGATVLNFIHPNTGDFGSYLCIEGSSANEYYGKLVGTTTDCNGAAYRAAYSTAPAANTWYHLVFTYKALTKVGTLYVNGAEAANATFTPTSASASSGTIRLGDQEGGDGNFDGAIDDLRIYSTTLSADQVRALYNE